MTILKARKIESLSTDWLRPITTDYDQLRTITDDYGRLTKEEYDILRYLLDHKTITRKEAVETANVQKTKAHKILSQLVEKKLIIKEGQARATHYILGDGQ